MDLENDRNVIHIIMKLVFEVSELRVQHFIKHDYLGKNSKKPNVWSYDILQGVFNRVLKRLVLSRRGYSVFVFVIPSQLHGVHWVPDNALWRE